MKKSKIIKFGEKCYSYVNFSEIKEGDTIFVNEEPHVCGCSAHLAEDASVACWVLYGKNGDSYFPEDLDGKEFEPKTTPVLSLSEKQLLFDSLMEAFHLRQIKEMAKSLDVELDENELDIALRDYESRLENDDSWLYMAAAAIRAAKK